MRHNPAFIRPGSGRNPSLSPAQRGGRHRHLLLQPVHNPRLAMTILAIVGLLAFAPRLHAAPAGQGSEPRKDLNQINDDWMQAIHNQPADSEQTLRLKNPGDPGAESAAPGPSEDSARKQAMRDAVERSIGSDTNSEDRVEAPSFLSLIFRFALALAVLGGMFYLVTGFLKKRSGLGRGGEGLMQVIASVPVMPGKFLQVVDLAGRIMVLGVSEQGVNLVTTIDDGLTADRIRIWNSQRGGDNEPGGDLMEKLTAIIRGTELKFWERGSAPGSQTRPPRATFSMEMASLGSKQPEDSNEFAPPVRDFGPPENRSTRKERGPGRDGTSSPRAPEELLERHQQASEDELARLLTRQKKRIAELKKRQPRGGDFTPGLEI